MKRIVMLLAACALILGLTAGCAWLCCDPCENAPDCPKPCNCKPCQ